MVTVLMVTGEPYYSSLAASILSMQFVTQEDPLAGIQRLVDRLGLGRRSVTILDIQSGDLVHALPELCSAECSVVLDVILAVDKGRELVAAAVVDYLLQGECSSETVVSLFKALAHRVDLRPALRKGLPLDNMQKILQQMMYARLDDHAAHLELWAPGWRLLACMRDRDLDFSGDPMVLLAVLAIDAAAADRLHGGAEELLNKFEERVMERALLIMLKAHADDKRLPSDEALVNVLRAFVSDGRLATRAFEWKFSRSKRVRLRVAAAHALISLLDDVSPCRFDPKLFANHAVADVARRFMYWLTDDVRYEIGKKVLTRIAEARSPS